MHVGLGCTYDSHFFDCCKTWIQLRKMRSKIKNYHATSSLGLPNPHGSVVETTDRPALADHTHRHGPHWWAQTGRSRALSQLTHGKTCQPFLKIFKFGVGNLCKIQHDQLWDFSGNGLWSKPFHQRATNDALRFCLGCRGSDGWGSWLYSIMLAPQKMQIMVVQEEAWCKSWEHRYKLKIYLELFYDSLIYQYIYIYTSWKSM